MKKFLLSVLIATIALPSLAYAISVPWQRPSAGIIHNLFIGDNVGVGSTSPTAKLSVHGRDGETNTQLFAVASSTASATSTLFSVGNAGGAVVSGDASNPFIVRQLGGVAGTDEVQIYHDGTDAYIAPQSGSLELADIGVGRFAFQPGAASVTPTFVLESTSGGGEAVALLTGTSGSGFYYTDTGYFAITSSTKAHITGGAAGTSGSEKLRVASDGTFTLSPDGTNTVATFSDSGAEVLLLQPDVATDIGLTVQGATSQSANLQEWQNSAGTVLASLASDGQLLLTDGSASSPSWSFVSDPDTGWFRDTTNTLGVTVGGQGQGIINATGWSIFSGVAGSAGNATIRSQVSDATTPVYGFFNDSDTGIGSLADQIWTIAGGSTILTVSDDVGDEAVLINPAAATDIGLTVQGATSQSANLQEWQNSAGTVLSSVSSGGALRTLNSGLGITPTSDTQTGFALSSNTVGVTVGNISNAVFTTDPSLTVNARTSSLRPLAIKGAAGQTADLTQWQNSSGVALSVVDATGDFGIGTTSPYAKLSVHANNGETNPWLFAVASSTASATTTHFYIENNGEVFMPSIRAESSSLDAMCYDATTGEIEYNSGAQSCTVSSARYKDNITEYASGLATVLKLDPVSFTDKRTQTESVGLIAEDVEQVDDRLVFYEEDGQTVRGVHYENLTAVLADAVQTLHRRILAVYSKVKSNEGRIERLERENEELRAELEVIKSKLQ